MTMRWRFMLLLLTILATTTIGVQEVCGQVVRKNVAQLTNLSTDIVVGRITHLDDGFLEAAGGMLPYTEVTLSISVTLKGKKNGAYTFRQFGLLEPRVLRDGRIYAVTTPAEMPTYKMGREVLLFLYRESPSTGLRTTVGLIQGKFDLVEGKAISGAPNAWLFEGVTIPPGALKAGEQQMLQQRGLLDAATFIAYIRKAVEQDWFAGVQ